MLSINGKKFMNISEAVQWLLDNNALPFQSTANYVADTVIAKSTIINPSPAEIKIGSLVLFADGKVGTVSGITANGFMVGAESTDLSDGVPHITDIDLDASGHLIITMSEGDPIDAGLVKMVSSMSIDASQHLIVNYIDGTTQDLGAIFQGSVTLSGDLTANRVYGVKMEDIKDVNGHNRFIEGDLIQSSPVTGMTVTYAKWSLSGTHLMFVLAGTADNGTTLPWTEVFVSTGPSLPDWVFSKIYPTYASTFVETKTIKAYNSGGATTQDMTISLRKGTNSIYITLQNVTFTDDRYFRIQFDLLIDNA